MRFLLTGARAPATLELARVLGRAGHQVEVAESLRPNLCDFSRWISARHRLPPARQRPQEFRQALWHLLERRSIDCLLPTCEEVFWLADLPRCWCVGREQLLSLHSKWQFQQRLAQHGLEPVPSQLCREAAELVPFCDGSHVIKSEFSRFAHGVWLRPRGAIPAGIGRGPWVAQPFLEGRELSALVLAQAGRILAWTVYPNQLRWGRGASLRFTALSHPGLEQWLERFVAGEALTGFVAFDFIESHEGRLWPLECNPRLTSGIHLLARCPQLAQVWTGQLPSVVTAPVNTTVQLSGALWLQGRWAQARQAQDVIWCPEDPGPAWGQPLTLLPLLWRALRHGLSWSQASTWDIEWNG